MLWALGIDAILLIAITSYLSFFHTILNTSSRSFLQYQALVLAEAGLHEALWELNSGGADFAGWTPISGTQPCTDLGGTSCFQRGSVNLTVGDGSGVSLGGFTVIVANPTSPNPTIWSQGTEDSSLIAQSLRATVALPLDNTFWYAAFGKYLRLKDDPSELGTVIVDSYVGAYDAATAEYDTSVTAYGSLMGVGDRLSVRSMVAGSTIRFHYDEGAS